MTKTNSKRNKKGSKIKVLFIALAIIVALGVFVTIFMAGMTTKATATTSSMTMTEQAFNDGRTTDPNMNTMYSAYIADMSRYAVKKQIDQYISDGYVKVENGSFTYYYQTEKGFFSVPAVGDTDAIVSLLYSDKKDVTDFIDISYNGETLKVNVTALP